jgi:hypothetical protein
LDNVLLSVSRDNLISAGSLSAYANNLQLVQTANRFNMARVKKFGYNLPTVLYDMVSDIAINGVAVPRTDTFIIQSIPDPIRSIIKRIGKHALKYALDCVKKGLGFIIRYKDLVKYSNEDLNFSGCLHAVLQDKVRMIHDHSSPSIKSVSEPLNSDITKESASEIYGKIEHPTIKSIITELLAFCRDNDIPLSMMRFTSMDVSNAFGKMKIKSEDVRFMPILIDELREIVLVRYMCSFGKSEYPFAYNIITKCLRLMISKVIRNGVVFIYVDDCFLFSYVDSAQDNLTVALKVHKDFLGDDAMNDDKSSSKPTIDGVAIGWYLNFETATISPSEKAMDKLKLTLFEILDSEALHWELQQVQSIVSLVIRYSVA